MSSLPRVTAPSLDALDVTVPRPPRPTMDDLTRRCHALARELGTQRPRAAGEKVAWGDDVCLDVAGFAAERVLPFSARTADWMEVARIPALPGFAEALAAQKVGARFQVQVSLGKDYPVPALRGVSATFHVHLRAAREVRALPLLGAEQVKKAGRGATPEELLRSLADELDREQTDAVWVSAENRVLDELARRAPAEVPAGLVDQELQSRWEQTEAPALRALDVGEAGQKAALAAWLTDDALRTEATRRVRIAAVLVAIVERDQIALTPAAMQQVLARAGKAFGAEPRSLKDAFRGQPALAEQAASAALHLLAVSHVMARAKVYLESALPKRTIRA